MTYSFVVSIWTDECSGPDSSLPDVTLPLDVLVPPGAVPVLAFLVQDVLSSHGLSSAYLVRFVHSSGVIADYWRCKIPA